MKGVINLYKPSGITSSKAVSKVKRILGEKTVGHMGTLDPLAEGVLLLGVGKAARLFDFYLNKTKKYEAIFEFGFETDTLDSEGTIVQQTKNFPSQADISAVLPSLTGIQQQLPPIYSAKSINGVRAYDLARQGKQVDLKTSSVEIYSLELVAKIKENAYKFEIACSGGTYIRSICRDLAYALNSFATMTYLKRTECGEFSAQASVSIDDLESVKDGALISVEDALKGLKRYDLKDELYTNLLHGIKIPTDKLDGEYALYCKGELFGIAVFDGYIKIKTYLKD